MGCAAGKSSRDIPVVKGFEAARYMGVWHEIARLPKWFERDLDNVTATYALINGELRITNRGFRNGEEKVSTAVGHFAGPADEGAFRISFFRPFYGDYRIIWLSQDYDLALVTGDDRSSLWILAREKGLHSARRTAFRICTQDGDIRMRGRCPHERRKDCQENGGVDFQGLSWERRVGSSSGQDSWP